MLTRYPRHHQKCAKSVPVFSRRINDAARKHSYLPMSIRITARTKRIYREKCAFSDKCAKPGNR